MRKVRFICRTYLCALEGFEISVLPGVSYVRSQRFVMGSDANLFLHRAPSVGTPCNQLRTSVDKFKKFKNVGRAVFEIAEGSEIRGDTLEQGIRSFRLRDRSVGNTYVRERA